MSYEVTDDYFNDIILNNHADHPLPLPNKMGFIQEEKIAINKDIMLCKHKICTNNDIVIKKPTKEFSTFCLVFNINANAKVSYSSLKQDLIYTNSQTIIGRISNSSANISLQKDNTLENICIILSEDFLQRYEIKQSKMDKTKIIQSITSNPKVNNLAQEIFYLNAQNVLDRIYLEGKLLEIIAIALFQIKQKKVGYKTQFSHYDIDALHRSREILENSFKNPPSIAELSKIVHLNEFKLKQGYKHLFEQTPYQTVLAKRLIYGKKMLEEGNLNITEISKKVGYKNIQNFTLAFVKYFGIKPKQLKKECLLKTK